MHAGARWPMLPCGSAPTDTNHPHPHHEKNRPRVIRPGREIQGTAVAKNEMMQLLRPLFTCNFSRRSPIVLSSSLPQLPSPHVFAGNSSPCANQGRPRVKGQPLVGTG